MNAVSHLTILSTKSTLIILRMGSILLCSNDLAAIRGRGEGCREPSAIGNPKRALATPIKGFLAAEL